MKITNDFCHINDFNCDVVYRLMKSDAIFCHLFDKNYMIVCGWLASLHLLLINFFQREKWCLVVENSPWAEVEEIFVIFKVDFEEINCGPFLIANRLLWQWYNYHDPWLDEYLIIVATSGSSFDMKMWKLLRITFRTERTDNSDLSHDYNIIIAVVSVAFAFVFFYSK